MTVSECAYQDKDGKEQKVLALRAEFSPAPDPTVTAGLDAPTAFLQTVSKYDVAVLRSQTTLDQDGYENDNAMNILMTSVEKCFLELDPNTGVSFYDLDFKTKHKLF